MLMTDCVFHLGQELDRAINRMDFFRLFNAMATHHGFIHFGLVELSGDTSEFRFSRAAHLYSWPEEKLVDADRTHASHPDPAITRLFQSTVPGALTREDGYEPATSPLAQACAASLAVAVPLHTPSGKCYGLILLGTRTKPSDQELATLAYEAAVVFQRYYETILSLDSVAGLTDREIQIVRWTSEGKTSGEIAIILGLSEHTINSYTATVLRKLQVVNRAQMVATAIRSGVIT